tara:strand:+ start:287 stop:604 length:318 start_codon:yes stop_codon:yes gene_type:complete
MSEYKFDNRDRLILTSDESEKSLNEVLSSPINSLSHFELFVSIKPIHPPIALVKLTPPADQEQEKHMYSGTFNMSQITIGQLEILKTVLSSSNFQWTRFKFASCC